MTNLIKEYLQISVQGVVSGERKLSPDSIALLSDKTILALNIPDEYVFNLSDLTPAEKTQVKKGKQSRDEVFSYDFNDTYSWGKIEKDSWSIEKLDASDTTTEMVFVEINRWQPINHSDSVLRKVKAACKAMGINLGNIYGLKSIFLKSKRFNNYNFIELHDYLKRELKDKSIKVPTFSHSVRFQHLVKNLINAGCDSDLFINFRDSVDANENEGIDIDRVKILEIYGLKVDKIDTPDKLYNQINDKYPMLNLVETRYDLEDSDIKVINDYIQSIDSLDNSGGE